MQGRVQFAIAKREYDFDRRKFFEMSLPFFCEI
jgi:hypothetical protein